MTITTSWGTALSTVTPQKSAPGNALHGLYDSFADFVASVFHRDERAEQVMGIQNAMSERVPADGGFLVPEQFRDDLIMAAVEEAIVRPRVRLGMPMRAFRVNVPSADPVTAANGGMLAGSWVTENSVLPESDPGFGRTTLEAKKLIAKSTVNNELFEDTAGLGAYLRATVPLSIAYLEDDAFIQGSGQGEPNGALNAPCAIGVTRASAPASIEQDVAAMYTRMWPQGHKRAVWLCSPDVLQSIVNIYVPIGTPATNVAVAASPWLGCDADGDITILGKKLIPTAHVPASGSQGDLAYVDFGAYVLGDREYMTVQVSPHNQFALDQSVIKVRHRVDGRMWLDAAITPPNGSQTVSPVVVRV
jgi:HK97 family phage major capsid protein